MSGKPLYDLDHARADLIVNAMRRGGPDHAAAITASWSRRALVWTCVTLAARITGHAKLEAPPPSTPQPRASVLKGRASIQPRLQKPIGPRCQPDELAWSDDDLRAAHAAYGRKERDEWTVQGESIYQRIRHRRRKAEREAAA